METLLNILVMSFLEVTVYKVKWYDSKAITWKKMTKALFSDYHRLIAEETEKSLEDSQKRLSHRERELHNQEERGLALEEKCGELKRALEIAKDDISQLRATINAMDREKDSLQHTVDDKTEKIAHLNEDILHKVIAVVAVVE